MEDINNSAIIVSYCYGVRLDIHSICAGGTLLTGVILLLSPRKERKLVRCKIVDFDNQSAF